MSNPVSPISSAPWAAEREKWSGNAPAEERPAPAGSGTADMPAETDEEGAAGIVSTRWPTLGRALGRYDRGMAERFSRLAYARIEGGVIRLEDRRQLGRQAEKLGIRPFDAQLLIACAIRQWALDRSYDPRPSPTAPRLSAEFRAWGRAWLRLGLILATAVALDLVIIYRWIG